MAGMCMYCLAEGNIREAHYLHQEQFTDHTLLERRMYGRNHQHLRGSEARPQSVNTLDFEERVLCCVKEVPELVQEGLQLRTVSQNRALQMLHKQLLYLNILIRAKVLYLLSQKGCVSQWLFKKCTSNPHFLPDILFNDKAVFTKDTTNVHNRYVWADEKPHAILQTEASASISD
jgi:hypothetical protein